MDSVLSFHEKAEFLREATGSTNLEKTLRKAVKILALFDIPHYVCGGFAVQEHGYPRFTVDVDIIVPDVAAAREKLAMNGFRENTGSKITDRETKVAVDLKPGAVEATRSNATLNGMDRRLDATDAPLGGSSSSNERPTPRTPRTYERAL